MALRSALSLRPKLLSPAPLTAGWALPARTPAASTHKPAIRIAPYSTRKHLISPIHKAAKVFRDENDQVPDIAALGVHRPDRVGFMADAERIVLLTGLPTTATPNDVRRLSNDPRASHGITHIEFLRTPFLNPCGKALVHFNHADDAVPFKADAHKRILGGKVIDARLLSPQNTDQLLFAHYAKYPQQLQLPLDLIAYETGKLVLLRGLPGLTTEDKLGFKLGRRYELVEKNWWRGKRMSKAGQMYVRNSAKDKKREDTYNLNLGPVLRLQNLNEDASTASFLIRLKTTHEAMRLCRRWHNTYFTPQRFNVDATGGRFKVHASIVH